MQIGKQLKLFMKRLGIPSDTKKNNKGMATFQIYANETK
jgi:hypothetical protein